MKKTGLIILSVVFMVAGLVSSVPAGEEGSRSSLDNKTIIEKLARLKEGQNGLNKRIDDLGKRLDGRIDDLGKRIDDQGKRLDGRIDDLGKRIDDLRGLMYVLLAGMFVLVGFVIWDRRTALSPAIRRSDTLERALKEFARKEPKMAEVLKSLGIL
ncbi:MAG: hypothetical protein J7M06_03250 [Proteobacteria bacterium]|nr:hypothetical protein [Pseudomonadota bacterium]